jgi:hypothetical protein
VKSSKRISQPRTITLQALEKMAEKVVGMRVVCDITRSGLRCWGKQEKKRELTPDPAGENENVHVENSLDEMRTTRIPCPRQNALHFRISSSSAISFIFLPHPTFLFKTEEGKLNMTAPCIALAIALTVLALTADAVPPVAWGPMHRHTEILYTLAIPGYLQRKEYAYDFPRRSMRMEATYLSGPKEYRAMNLTSWWINNTLTMLSYNGSTPMCNQLDMGFGLPVPNWFQFGSTTVDPGLYLTRHYSGSDGLYHRAVWTRKSIMPFGYFNYFSFNDTGAPFRMSAPSPPQGEVVNEYYNFKNVTGFPEGTFDVPANCNTSAPAHRLTKTDVGPVEAAANLALHVAAKELELPHHLAGVYASFVAQLVMMATAHW